MGVINWREPEIDPERVMRSRWILVPVVIGIPFWGLFLAAAIHARSTVGIIVYAAWVALTLVTGLLMLRTHRAARRGEPLRWRGRRKESS
jgi:hypothetical protein